jgi:RNA polymerase sigma factor for flagellar operon FliA
MNARELFEANLAVIERAIARVCADASLRGADAEDFASDVKVKLLERDGHILSQWKGQSSFATYLTVVIRRLLVDRRRAEGRWYPSKAAQERGEAAVLLERLLHRDHRSLDEAVVLVRHSHPELSAAAIRALAGDIPARPPRLRLVPISDDDNDLLPGGTPADVNAADYDLARRAEHTNRAVAEAMASLSAQDRAILRFRYVEGLSIADISRVLHIPQRPLYRRIESLLRTLREALESAGLDAASVEDLIGASAGRLDFRLGWKNEEHHPSLSSAETEGSGSRP